MENAEAAGKTFAARLASASTAGYAGNSASSPLDTTIKQAIEVFSALAPRERGVFAAALDSAGHWEALRGFALRMATQAISEHSAARVADGLLALVVEGGRFDWRETLIVLSLLHHSAEVLDADATALFDRAAALAGPDTARRLRDFVRRDASLKRIEAFGYRCAGVGKDVRYEWIG